MKCIHCNTIIDDISNTNICPSCGKNVGNDGCYDTIEGAFAYIFSAYGIEIINDKQKFIAILGDYAPRLDNERRVIKIALDADSYNILLKENKSNQNEQEICLKKQQQLLEQQFFLSSEWAKRVLRWFANYLGWNSSILEESNDFSNSETQNSKNNYISENISTEIEPYLKRALIFIEDDEWEKANEYCEKVLDIKPECADAYLTLAMVDEQVKSIEAFIEKNCTSNKNYIRAKQYADEKLRQKLISLEKETAERIKKELKEQAEAERLRREAEKEALKKRNKEIERIKNRTKFLQGMIQAGYHISLAIKADGTALATKIKKGFLVSRKGQDEVENMENLISISCWDEHTVGLRKDGTVVAVGRNKKGQCDVANWKDIIAVAAGNHHTVGLKSDGTVVAIGDKGFGMLNVNNWSDIVAITAGCWTTFGLKSNGTVVFTGCGADGEGKVSGWNNITAISCFNSHSVGLKCDGTVVATGSNKYGQCNVEKWRDIISISAGYQHTVGLKVDGTVVATGNSSYGECNVSNWRDIVAISAGYGFTIGLKSDGTMVSTGLSSEGQRNIDGWKLFNSLQDVDCMRG